jgi:hypothetical protein
MGQKTNPIGFRLAVNKDWRSKWFASRKEFPEFLASDIKIRTTLISRTPCNIAVRFIIPLPGAIPKPDKSPATKTRHITSQPQADGLSVAVPAGGG